MVEVPKKWHKPEVIIDQKMVIKRDTQIHERIKKPKESTDTKPRMKDHKKNENGERRATGRNNDSPSQREKRKPLKGEYIAKGTGNGRENMKQHSLEFCQGRNRQFVRCEYTQSNYDCCSSEDCSIC